MEYEVTYFEMVIPLCNESQVCQDRRLRFYLTNVVDPTLDNFQATPFDLLLSQSPKGFDFGWISSARGLPDLIPTTQPEDRPSDAVQIPSTQFLSPPPSSLFSLAISPPLEVPRRPKEKFIFTLHFDLSNLFFFDNTDEQAIDADLSIPPHFNALTSNSNLSRDGTVNLFCPETTFCLTAANFWPGLPGVIVSVAQEEEG